MRPNPVADQAIEERIRALIRGGRIEDAITLAVKQFQFRLHYFVLGIVRDPDDANDVMQEVWSTVVHHALTAAERDSFRGWLYCIARNAALDTARRVSRRKGYLTALTQAVVSAIAEESRSAVDVWLRSSVKVGIAALRAELGADDQLLLELRADHGLEFADVARNMTQLPNLSGPELKRAVSRYAKRYHKLKVDLGQLARARGIVKS